jgi:hypothetical protein
MRYSRCLLIAAAVSQSGICAQFAYSADGHIQLNTTYDMYNIEGPTVVNHNVEFDFHPNYTSGRTTQINLGWAVATGTIRPAIDDEPGFVSTYAGAAPAYLPNKESAFAEGWLYNQIENPAGSGVIKKFTVSAQLYVGLSGDLIHQDWYHATIFGNAGAWEAGIRAPGATTSKNGTIRGSTRTLNWGAGVPPWDVITGQYTRTFSFLLYPGKSARVSAYSFAGVYLTNDYGLNVESGAICDGVMMGQDVGTIRKFQLPGPGAAWNDPVWDGPVPNGPCSIAYFGASESDKSVSLTTATTVGRVAFESATGHYSINSINGSHTLTFQCGSGEVGIDSLAGSHTISAPVSVLNNFSVLVAGSSDELTVNGPTTYIGGVSFIKSGAGTAKLTSLPTGPIDISEGRVKVTGTQSVYTSELGMSEGTQLDLVNNDLVVDYATGTDSPRLEIRRRLAEGRGTGTWDQIGIAASAAGTDPARKRALGYVEASVLLPSGGTFSGHTVDTSAVLVKYTFNGDVNLDQAVNFDDLLKLAQNYGVTTSSWEWWDGDISYDGKVDFDDMLSLAQNYGASGAVRRGGLDGAYMVYIELEAGAPWILADMLSRPEGQALFGSYLGEDRNNSDYITSLQDYNLKPAPEPTSLLSIAATTLFGLTRGRRRTA